MVEPEVCLKEEEMGAVKGGRREHSNQGIQLDGKEIG